MSVGVRSGTEADLPAVRRLLVETWHATYDHIFGVDKVTEMTGRWHAESVLAEQLAKPGAAFLVAERKGAIVGTLYARAAGQLTTVLDRLYVLPAEQGSGVGRSLYEAMLAHFPECGRIRLEVAPDNTPAIAFYRRLGFTQCSSGAACGGDRRAAIAHLVMEKVP